MQNLNKTTAWLLVFPISIGLVTIPVCLTAVYIDDGLLEFNIEKEDLKINTKVDKTVKRGEPKPLSSDSGGSTD